MDSSTPINSLDPRINRLSLVLTDQLVSAEDKAQLATFEVFQQIKAGKPFEHAGIVHSSDADLAWMFAKEQFSRRGGMCESMFVVATAEIMVSQYTEGAINVLDIVKTYQVEPSDLEDLTSYDVFYQKKRGKQHYHAGRVKAGSAIGAMVKAATELPANPCLNVWVAPTDAVLFADSDDKDIWLTLPEKKYRDAIAYKSQDKIDRYKQLTGQV